MLQGESASDMAALVAEHKGELTHSLHIIDAVGALLSRQQLDSILGTGKVSRHIDDLSVSIEDEPDTEEPACEVGGSLEVMLADRQLSWALHNKGPGPEVFTSLEMSWPEQLGYLQSLSIDGKEFERGPHTPGLSLTFEEGAAPSVTGVQRLEARFSNNAVDIPQREFSINVGFGEYCSAQLIPGYANNSEDSYYPSVVEADRLHLNGVTGRGVTVAVLDSGLWEHPALLNDTQGKPRVHARYDAIANEAGDAVFDESGHGTHMTSVMAHSGPVTGGGKPLGWYKGIAPDAGIVAIKAFNEEGQGDFLDIVRGVQFALDNREKYNIRVLNLSFAARPRWPYWDDPINQAIMRAWQAGITVIAAAGNEGPEPMSIGSPGNLPYIITVGAITDSWTLNTRDDDYIPDFSSQGPTPTAHIKPDIVAPGGHMSGLTRPGSTLTQRHPEYMLSTGEFVMTGTSQAAALVSGIAALLLQLEPTLTPDDVKCMLTTSAELAINRDGLLAYSPFQQGHGYVNATRAVTLGERGCGNIEMELANDIAGVSFYEGPAIINENGEVTLPGLEKMLSPTPSAEGLSTTRKWGVKEHLEREDPSEEMVEGAIPFDWMGLYEQERLKIEALQKSNN
ncbi:MAG: S8 family peptidase [Pseudomonadota bacterium]